MAKTPIIQQVAGAFCAMNPGLRYLQEYDSFYNLDPNTKHLKSISDRDLERMLAPYLESTHEVSVVRSTFDNVIMWIRLKCVNIEEINTGEIIFNDHYILNLSTFEMYPYSGQHVFYRIDAPHPTEESVCPRFDQFIKQVLVKEDTTTETDPELIYLAQEMFGYYLLDKIEPPVAFFLVGDGSNGKSTLQFALEQIVGGPEFVMANSIENLTGDKFATGALRFKRLNICSEEQSRYIKSDKFKGMLEGAIINSSVKFKDDISFRPKTKHIFATNKMPLFDTIDYGMRRRFMILPFYRRFLPHETDKTLKTKNIKDSVFYKEIPGIVKWAIEGAKRLIANNYTFSASKEVDAQMDNYEQNVSSVVAFLRENFSDFNDESKEFFNVDRLYHLYSVWCRRNNKKPMASNNFREDARRVMKCKAISGWDKVEKRTYRGYRMTINSNSEIYISSEYLIHVDLFNEPSEPPFSDGVTNIPML